MFDATRAPRPPAHTPRGNLERDLEAGMRDSLDYQILRRTLIPEEVDAQPQAASVSDPTGEPPVVASQATDFQQIVDQRDLQLNVTLGDQSQKTDPLVLDLASNGFSTSSLSHTVTFDLDGDGQREAVSVPTADDALLALDRNGNGQIDDGRELFGDQNGARNGFAELSRYDDNQDGRIDLQDAVFQRLSLLRFDAGGEQRSQSLAKAGVSAIHLQARDVQIALGAYDEIAQLGHFEFSDGRAGQAADLLLARR